MIVNCVVNRSSGEKVNYGASMCLDFRMIHLAVVSLAEVVDEGVEDWERHVPVELEELCPVLLMHVNWKQELFGLRAFFEVNSDGLLGGSLDENWVDVLQFVLIAVAVCIDGPPLWKLYHRRFDLSLIKLEAVIRQNHARAAHR